MTAVLVGRPGEQILRCLLGRGDVDVNARDKFGKSVLCRAVESECADAVKWLLERRDIQVNTLLPVEGDMYYSRFTTAFYAAVESQNIDIVRHFLTRSDLNFNIGTSPLILAVRQASQSESGQLILEELLKRHDLDLNRIFDGYSALVAAINDPDTSALKLLLAREDLDINSHEFDFHLLATSPELVSIRLQQSWGTPESGSSASSFQAPSAAAAPEPAPTPLTLEMETKEYRITALQFAICLRNEEAVSLLCSRSDLDPNRYGQGTCLPSSLVRLLPGREKMVGMLKARAIERGDVRWDAGGCDPHGEMERLDLSLGMVGDVEDAGM